MNESKNPCPQIRVTLKYISPPVAAKLLETNPEHQRTISAANLRKIEASLKTDTFMLNGQSVIVDEDGRLLDGQHRLQAAVNTGIGFWTVYVTGVPSEYFKFMDCGKARTFSDVLKTKGHAGTRSLAAAISRLAEYQRGPTCVGSNMVLAHSELVATIEGAPRLDEAMRACRACSSVIAPSQVAWLYYLAHPLVPDLCDFFFYSLTTGENLIKTSPIFLFRQRLDNDRKSGFHPHLREMEALLIKAWNAYIKGEQMKALVWQSPREPFPELVLPAKRKAS